MAAKAWLFDMDGVLVDSCRWHVLAWREFASRHGCSITEEQVLGWMGATNRVYMERLLGHPVPDAELAALEDEKEGVYREMFAPHMTMPPGLRRLLDLARERHILCAVATGGPRKNVDFVLDGLGMRADFACVVEPSQYARGGQKGPKGGQKQKGQAC